ncbi:Hypothetical predicted protein, partial [Pelobates cultripes]
MSIIQHHDEYLTCTMWYVERRNPDSNVEPDMVTRIHYGRNGSRKYTQDQRWPPQ